jgi:hypothetical protein
VKGLEVKAKRLWWTRHIGHKRLDRRICLLFELHVEQAKEELSESTIDFRLANLVAQGSLRSVLLLGFGNFEALDERSWVEDARRTFLHGSKGNLKLKQRHIFKLDVAGGRQGAFENT